jgi:hypothetical protein
MNGGGGVGSAEKCVGEWTVSTDRKKKRGRLRESGREED